MICSYCGKSINSLDKFCPSCGTEIKSNPGKSGKKELSNEEKAANKIINFLIAMVILGFVMYFAHRINQAHLQEYRAKKMYELYK